MSRAKPQFEQQIETRLQPLRRDNTRARYTILQQEKLIEFHRINVATADEWHKQHLLQNADKECSDVVRMFVGLVDVHGRLAAARVTDEHAKLENERINLGKVEDQLVTCNTDDEDDRPYLEKQAQTKRDRIQTRELQRDVAQKDLELLEGTLDAFVRDLEQRDPRLAATVERDIVERHRKAVESERASTLVKHLMLSSTSLLVTMEKELQSVVTALHSEWTSDDIDRISYSLQQVARCLRDGDLPGVLGIAHQVQDGTHASASDEVLYYALRREATRKSSPVQRLAPKRITQYIKQIADRAAQNDAPPALPRLLADTADAAGNDVCRRWADLYGPTVDKMLNGGDQFITGADGAPAAGQRCTPTPTQFRGGDAAQALGGYPDIVAAP